MFGYRPDSLGWALAAVASLPPDVDPPTTKVGRLGGFESVLLGVIDVIRDSLFLFAEALAVTGDRFALYGFPSRKRQHVRVRRIKTFGERYDAAVRGRINAIKPGYCTRMGAAVRYTAGLLSRQTAARRLLVLPTDGKPNDLDQYEGRYGIEDTRMTLLEARRQGLHPFCATIDQEADDYLPYRFLARTASS